MQVGGGRGASLAARDPQRLVSFLELPKRLMFDPSPRAPRDRTRSAALSVSPTIVLRMTAYGIVLPSTDSMTSMGITASVRTPSATLST